MDSSVRAFFAALAAAAALCLALAGCASGPGPITLYGPPVALAGSVTGFVTSPVGPVSGATVSLAPSGMTTLTDAAGFYELDGVVPGGYLLHASAAGFADSSRAVAVVAGRTSTGSLAMSQSFASGSIFGHVTDGLLAVPRARVDLNGARLTALTTDDGTFDFASVAPGDYDVTVSRPGFATVSTVAHVAVNDRLRLEIQLPRRTDGVVTGRITDGVNGIANCQRLGVAVLFFDSTSLQETVPNPAACAASHGLVAVDDHFRFENLATGTYILQAAVNGFRTGTKVLQVLGGAVNDGDMVLTLTGTTSAVTGVVLDSTLLSVSRATVTLSEGSTQLTTTTGPDGRYQFTGLTPGAAALSVTASGSRQASLALTLSAGNTADGSVVLGP